MNHCASGPSSTYKVRGASSESVKLPASPSSPGCASGGCGGSRSGGNCRERTAKRERAVSRSSPARTVISTSVSTAAMPAQIGDGSRSSRNTCPSARAMRSTTVKGASGSRRAWHSTRSPRSTTAGAQVSKSVNSIPEGETKAPLGATPSVIQINHGAHGAHGEDLFFKNQLRALGALRGSRLFLEAPLDGEVRHLCAVALGADGVRLVDDGLAGLDGHVDGCPHARAVGKDEARFAGCLPGELRRDSRHQGRHPHPALLDEPERGRARGHLRGHGLGGEIRRAERVLRLPSRGQRHFRAVLVEAPHAQPREGRQRQLRPEQRADAQRVGEDGPVDVAAVHLSASSRAALNAVGSSSISQCETPAIPRRCTPGSFEARNGFSRPSASMAHFGPLNFASPAGETAISSSRSCTNARGSHFAAVASTASRVSCFAFVPSISPKATLTCGTPKPGPGSANHFFTSGGAFLKSPTA